MLTLTSDDFGSMAKRAVVPSLSGGVPRERSSGLNLVRMSDSARVGSVLIASRTCSINDVWDSAFSMAVKAKVRASMFGYYRYSANGAMFLTSENYGVLKVSESELRESIDALSILIESQSADC